MENSDQEENYDESGSEGSYIDQCAICLEDIEIYGIAPCNHNNVCGQCHYKMRVKDNIKCVYCKVKR